MNITDELAKQADNIRLRDIKELKEMLVDNKPINDNKENSEDLIKTQNFSIDTNLKFKKLGVSSNFKEMR